MIRADLETTHTDIGPYRSSHRSQVKDKQTGEADRSARQVREGERDMC